MDCPSPEVWVGWNQNGLRKAEHGAHLLACASCRAELASLATSGEARHSGGLRWAAAAGLLLALGWMLLGKEPGPGTGAPAPQPPAEARAPEAVPAPGGIFSASSLTEMLIGASGEAVLAPGTRGRLDGGFHLEAGQAWVEAAGEPLKISVAGCDGFWELTDGGLAIRAGVPDSASLLARAWAEEAAWGARVLSGEAVFVSGGERRTIRAGDASGLSVTGDPRVWHETGSFSLKDGLRSLEGAEGPLVGEILLRKQDRAAESALLFAAGGKVWQVPLGVHLTAEQGWVRLRLERGGGRIRLLAGGREVLSCPISELASKAYPADASLAWGLRAWGGDIEVKQARWRTP